MATLNDSVIEVRDLVKQYAGVRVVDGVSFNVHRGEIFGMVAHWLWLPCWPPGASVGNS